MICLRCKKDTARISATAPDGSNAWEIYTCSHCNYVWRSTEEPTVTDPERRDPAFQLEDVDLNRLLNVIPIPALKHGQ